MNTQAVSHSERDQLRTVSSRLLALHKRLLELQRVEYEQLYGPIASTGEFLNLVLTHPSFEWLRQLSGIIVEIDEVVAPRSKAGVDESVAALRSVRKLLMPSEEGSVFQQNYWKAIQSSPDVLIAHREVGTLLSAADPVQRDIRS